MSLLCGCKSSERITTDFEIRKLRPAFDDAIQPMRVSGDSDNFSRCCTVGVRSCACFYAVLLGGAGIYVAFCALAFLFIGITIAATVLIAFGCAV